MWTYPGNEYKNIVKVKLSSTIYFHSLLTFHGFKNIG